MPDELIRLVFAAVLVTSAGMKLRSPRTSQAALATFGISGLAQPLAWALLISTEAALAVMIVAGSDSAAYTAAALMLIMAATLVGAILRGQAGADCGCFGPRSTVSWTAVVRNLALAAAFASIPALSDASLSTDQVLGLGLVVALLACLGLAIAVLALAREVGMLRLRVGPESALEITDEGPELGAKVALPGLTDRGLRDDQLAVAVFTSEGCHVCRALEPAIASLAGEPTIEVQTFEEGRDIDVWRALRIPGSPYVLVTDPTGSALAKGTFNNLAQIESVIATAERRRAAREIVESYGV